MSIPVLAVTQSETDAALERRIEQARITMTAAETQDAKREAYEDMRWLISQRSAAQISRMEERIEGLR